MARLNCRFEVYADHLDTPRVITDGSNNVVWEWDHSDPFGNNLPVSNGFEFNLRFPGQYFDRETNLHYNYFRDYDPSTGRYIQSDPIGLAGGINTYAYVGGNPISRIDPDGLQAKEASMPKWWDGLTKPTTDSQYCATGECAAGVLPNAPQSCCDGPALSDCLLAEASAGSKDCFLCAISRGRDKNACKQCGAAGGSISMCFANNCGRDKCKSCD